MLRAPSKIIFECSVITEYGVTYLSVPLLSCEPPLPLLKATMMTSAAADAAEGEGIVIL